MPDTRVARHAGGWRRRAQLRSDGGPGCLTATPTTARRLGAPSQSPIKSPRLYPRATRRGRSGLTKRKQSELWRRRLLLIRMKRWPSEVIRGHQVQSSAIKCNRMKRWPEHDDCSIDRARILHNLPQSPSISHHLRARILHNRPHRMHAAAARALCRARRCMRRPWLSSTCRSCTCRSKAVRLEARR